VRSAGDRIEGRWAGIFRRCEVAKSVRAEFQIDRPDISDAELGKAWGIAKRVLARHLRHAPWWIDRESLEAAARGSFWLAVTRYDRAQAAQLASYTTRAVLNGLQEEERVQSPWTRPQQELVREYRREGRELEPWMRDTLWIDAPLPAATGSGSVLPSDVQAATTEIDRDGMTEGLGREARCALAARLLTAVTPRHRELLVRYFYGEQIFRDIGKAMGFSESRAHQLRNQAFATIRQAFPGVEALL
jgi:DNA-directed RNA polymerase specialized sigma subunit